MRFSKRLRALKKDRGFTQEQLAELSGIDYKHLQLLEGKNPPAIRIDTLEKLAKALRTTCSKFMDF